MFNSLQPLHNGIFPTTKTGGNEADLPTQALFNLLVCSLVLFFFFFLQDLISLFTWLTVRMLCCSHAPPLCWYGFAWFSSNLLTFCSWACLTRWNEISVPQFPPQHGSARAGPTGGWWGFLGQLVISQTLSHGRGEVYLCSEASHLCNKVLITLLSSDQWALCKY